MAQSAPFYHPTTLTRPFHIHTHPHTASTMMILLIFWIHTDAVRRHVAINQPTNQLWSGTPGTHIQSFIYPVGTWSRTKPSRRCSILSSTVISTSQSVRGRRTTRINVKIWFLIRPISTWPQSGASIHELGGEVGR